MALLRLLESVGAIDLIKKLLGPVVELIGIDRRAVPMTVTGLAMGITYGSGLIIHEVRNGKASHQDAVASVSLMGLSHALIEDTIVLSLFGASVIGILWARMAFAMLVVALLFRIRPRWGAALALPKGSGAAAAG
jgi:spore maturation protein SpmB